MSRARGVDLWGCGSNTRAHTCAHTRPLPCHLPDLHPLARLELIWSGRETEAWCNSAMCLGPHGESALGPWRAPHPRIRGSSLRCSCRALCRGATPWCRELVAGLQRHPGPLGRRSLGGGAGGIGEPRHGSSFPFTSKAYRDSATHGIVRETCQCSPVSASWSRRGATGAPREQGVHSAFLPAQPGQPDPPPASRTAR